MCLLPTGKSDIPMNLRTLYSNSGVTSPLPGSADWGSLVSGLGGLKDHFNYAVYSGTLCQFQMGRKESKMGQIGENRRHP